MKKLTLISFFTFSSSFFIYCSAQNINTVAGSAAYGYSGDGGQATAAELRNPLGVIVDANGNLYISDYGSSVVRKVDAAGIITTLAGTGTAGYNGDNIQATAAEIKGPGGLGLDSLGNVYISELNGCRIRKVDGTSGIITTVAGTGLGGFSGDGGQATAAQISFPTDVKFDKKGNFYIADESTERVRKVNTSGIINTIAGNGTANFSGDGGPATAAELYSPTGVAIDKIGKVYIGDQNNNRIRVVDTFGIITTFAGNGTAGFTGDGGPATAAELRQPEEVAIDPSGNVYIDDAVNNAIRMIDLSGTISTYAGNGVAGFYGDGGPATAAELSGQQGVCTDKNGNVYIGDYGNSRVRKVGNISTGTSQLIIDNGQLTIFPNPAKEELNIALTGLTGKVIVTLFTIQGKEMIKQIFSNQQTITLNTSSISTGMYILRIQKEDGKSLIRKIEIQK